jgi:hypothetical protein
MKFKMQHDFNQLREYESVIHEATAKGQSVVVTLDRLHRKDFNKKPLVFDTVTKAQDYISAHDLRTQFGFSLYRGSNE